MPGQDASRGNLGFFSIFYKIIVCCLPIIIASMRGIHYQLTESLDTTESECKTGEHRSGYYFSNLLRRF